jgi:hypothetical protein
MAIGLFDELVSEECLADMARLRIGLSNAMLRAVDHSTMIDAT